VNGFAGGRVNRIGGFTEVTRANAHAWVEVHFAGAGWVRYDPTPPDMRWQAGGDLSLLEQLAELGSVIELWWFQRVVDFDSSDQIFALRSIWRSLRDLELGLGWADTPSAHPDTAPDAGDGLAPPRVSLPAWPLLASGAAAGALVWAWRWRRSAAAGDARVALQYRRALRLLARRRLPRGEATPARTYARQVQDAAGPDVARPLETLTEAYLARRFGGRRDAADATLDAALAELRAALRGRPHGVRAAVAGADTHPSPSGEPRHDA